MAEPVIPAAAPMSAIPTSWYPRSATSAAAASRIRRRRSGSRRRRATSTTRPAFVEQLDRYLDQPGAEVLAEALGLGVGTGRGGHPVAEQPDDHEVDRAQVGQLVPVHGQPGRLGQQLDQALD